MINALARKALRTSSFYYLLLALIVFGQPRLSAALQLTDPPERESLPSVTVEPSGTRYLESPAEAPSWDTEARLSFAVNEEFLSNGQFVYGSNVADFHLATYLSQSHSPLAKWDDEIENNALFASVNPRVILTVLEILKSPSASGKGAGPEMEIQSITRDLAGHFYDHLRAHTTHVVLTDKTLSGIGPNVNAGTFAVLATLSPRLNPSEWKALSEPQAERSFLRTYNRLFPDDDPLDRSNDLSPIEKAYRSLTEAAVPANDFLQLPFPIGETWKFSGVHAWCGVPGEPGCSVSQPLSSIDFSPNFTSCPAKCKSSPDGYKSSVVAAAEGTYQTSSGCLVRISHQGDWATSYYHLTEVDLPPNRISQNEPLARIGCECCIGGSARTAHVHFSLLYKGAYAPWDGVKLSGWTVHSGVEAYGADTYLEKDGKKIFAQKPITNTPFSQSKIEFSSSAYSIEEGPGAVTVTVTRSGDNSTAAAVSYTTSNGTASRGNDYRLASGVLSFTAGQTTRTFSVPIIDDTIQENDETINLTLSNPSGTSLGALTTAVITIRANDQGPKLEFSAPSVNVRENAGSVLVTVTRTGATGSTIDVGYSTESGSALGDFDFRPQSGRLTFGLGVTSRDIIVPILNDLSQEGLETFSIRLFQPSWGVTIGRQDRISVLIEDDETAASPPAIDRLSPLSYPISTSNQAMTIFGSDFQNGLTLTFDPPTGQNIASLPSRLNVISASQISYQFTPTVAGTWTVTVKNPDGQMSNTVNFTVTTGTGPALPTTPTNTKPGNTSSPGPTTSSTSVILSWSNSNGANSYSVGLRDIATNQLVVDTTTSGTSFTADLSAGRQYRWNVAACNSTGCSPFTTPLYFQTPGTVPAPSIPTNTSPGSTNSPGPITPSTTVTLSWSAANGATSYNLGVRDMITNQLVVSTTISGTSYTDSLSGGRQYRWNVAACNSAGCSAFTTPLYFQTPGAVSVPPIPSNTSPGSTSSPGPTTPSTTVTLNWSPSNGATSYSVGVRDMATNQLVIDTTTSGNSYTDSLGTGRQYRWNVAACNSAGCSSFTTPLYFQTPGVASVPSMPNNTSPGSTSSPGPTLSSATVTMSWNASTGATSYSFGVRDMTTNQLVVDTTTSSTSFSASLSAGRQYRWNVAACNSAGCSAFTTPLYFQTPGVVSVPSTPSGASPGSTSSPGPTMSGNTVTMSWNASTGAHQL